MTGDPPAHARFLGLLGPLHDGARRTARRLARSTAEGDDLFQEAALRALEHMQELRDESLFRPWFYRVLLTVHRNRARRDFWRRFLPFELRAGDRDPGRPSIDPMGDDGARWEDDRVRARRMAEALGTLPAEMREAVVLFELEELSLDEVASLQGASLSAVKTRLARARERLRRHYLRVLPPGAAPAAGPTGATGATVTAATVLEPASPEERRS